MILFLRRSSQQRITWAIVYKVLMEWIIMYLQAGLYMKKGGGLENDIKKIWSFFFFYSN